MSKIRAVVFSLLAYQTYSLTFFLSFICSVIVSRSVSVSASLALADIKLSELCNFKAIPIFNIKEFHITASVRWLKMRLVKLSKGSYRYKATSGCTVQMHILPPSGERVWLHFKEKMIKMPVWMRVMGYLWHENLRNDLRNYD